MSTTRHQHVKRIFFSAVELPEDQRGAYLREACGGDDSLRAEVVSLLAHDDVERGAFAEADMAAMREVLVDAIAVDSGVSPGKAELPRRVGRYEILRAIGHGGMGVVYEARQVNPNRTVAIKVIRPGLATDRVLRRFEQEAQVLGRLQHPGIAHIYEAGIADVVTSGGQTIRQPFIAMELIRGRSLPQFVREAQLPTRARLELLSRVCDAVEHAHVAGVIHRDLKPANILVDATGQPKVLDFGVARLTDGEEQVTTFQTDVGQLIGTLPYMSPEQVTGRSDALDQRSDVYALGVILYEMLSGALPYDLRTRSVPDAINLIQTAEPTRLSAVNTHFRGDIETIIAKALEKDPPRRYSSAASLAADLRRYLAHQPIAARPASAAYQFRKFARRNKVAVSSAAAIFIVLVGAVVATSSGMLRAQRAESLARDQFEQAQVARGEAEAVNAFLADMLAGADPAKHGGRELTVREMLDEAARHVDDYGDGTPAVVWAVHKTIGRTYQQIGEYRRATSHFSAALALAEQVYGPGDARTQRSLYDWGDNLFICGDLAQVEERLLPAIAALRAEASADPEFLARQLYTLGRVQRQRAQYAASIASFREAIGLFRRGGPQADGLAGALNALGNVLSQESRHREAEAALREALAILQATYGADSAHAAGILANLAVAVKRQGRLEDAEALYREGLRVLRATHGNAHPSTIIAIMNLGGLLAESKRLDEAEPLLREALQLTRAVHGDDSFHAGIARGKLAQALRAEGEWVEAEAMARASLDTLQRVMGEHPYTATALSSLAGIEFDKGAYQTAADLYGVSAEMFRQTLGDDHSAVADMLELQAEALAAAQSALDPPRQQPRACQNP